MINIKLHGDRVADPEQFAEAIAQTQTLEQKWHTQPEMSAPDMTPDLEAQIMDLLAKPRTTLNTRRMNKLLKQAGLDASFGKHKGKL